MPTRELAALRRETSRLRESLGAATARPVVFRAHYVDAPTELLTIEGDPFTGSVDDAMVIDVAGKALGPLVAGKRHAVLHGGRAGTKSHTVARYLLAQGYARALRILCVREVQNSIVDSVHSLLRDCIDEHPELLEFYEIQRDAILGANGTQFAFRGLRKESAHSVKGYEAFDIAWCEEAAALSRRSIDLLVPTIRKPGSRLLWTLNPEDGDDPAYKDFVGTDERREEVAIAQVLYTDNPWLSDVSRADAEWDKRTDPAKYRHTWLGGLRERGRGQIFPEFEIIPAIDPAAITFRTAAQMRSHGREVQTRFEREHGKGAVFCGLDWGHGGANHPTHAVLGWLSAERNTVMILAEYRAQAATLDRIAAELPVAIPLLRDRAIPIWADSSRPESAAHLRLRRLNSKSCPKWPNSVLQGIERLRSARILIGENCTETIKDFSLYSWMLDANDEPTGEPEKRHDHGPDALRYGVHQWIRTGTLSGYVKMRNTFM